MDISSNVKILNENTLVLESDAAKGDTKYCVYTI